MSEPMSKLENGTGGEEVVKKNTVNGHRVAVAGCKFSYTLPKFLADREKADNAASGNKDKKISRTEGEILYHNYAVEEIGNHSDRSRNFDAVSFQTDIYAEKHLEIRMSDYARPPDYQGPEDAGWRPGQNAACCSVQALIKFLLDYSVSERNDPKLHGMPRVWNPDVALEEIQHTLNCALLDQSRRFVGPDKRERVAVVGGRKHGKK